MKVSDKAYSETVGKGFVISTSPGPGDRVREDGTVEAVVSLGPERHKVPDVRGDTLDDAQQALDEAGLEYGDAVNRFHGKLPKGRVIGTDPAAGIPLRPTRAVDVIVSKGPRPIKIPDHTGKPADQAKAGTGEARLRGGHHRGQQRHRPQRAASSLRAPTPATGSEVT